MEQVFLNANFVSSLLAPVPFYVLLAILVAFLKIVIDTFSLKGDCLRSIKLLNILNGGIVSLAISNIVVLMIYPIVFAQLTWSLLVDLLKWKHVLVLLLNALLLLVFAYLVFTYYRLYSLKNAYSFLSKDLK